MINQGNSLGGLSETFLSESTPFSGFFNMRVGGGGRGTYEKAPGPLPQILFLQSRQGPGREVQGGVQFQGLFEHERGFPGMAQPL
jgi:hypothetical protein